MALEKIYTDTSEGIKDFRKKNASVIGDLNQVYITSRYLPIEFNQYQVEAMTKFTHRLVKFLEEL